MTRTAQEQNVQEGGRQARKGEAPLLPKSLGLQILQVGGGDSHTPTRPRPAVFAGSSLHSYERQASVGHVAATCCCNPSTGEPASPFSLHLPSTRSWFPILGTRLRLRPPPGPLPSSDVEVVGGALAGNASFPYPPSPTGAPLLSSFAPLLIPPSPPLCRSPARSASAWASRSESLGNRAGSADSGRGKPARVVSICAAGRGTH